MNKKTQIILLILSHMLCVILGYCIASIHANAGESLENTEPYTDSTIKEESEEITYPIEEIKTDTETTEEATTEEPSEAKNIPAEEPSQLPPSNDPIPPATQPPVIQPTETEPPATEPPATEPPVTTPPIEVPSAPDIDIGDNGTPIG